LSEPPRHLRARRAAAALLLLGTAFAWLAPYDVTHFVAKQEPVLLGRYTVGIFTGLAVGSALLLLVASLLASRRGLGEAAALLALAVLSVAAGLSIVSFVTYVEIAPRYLRVPVAEAVSDPALRARLQGTAMTRHPGLVWKTVRRDEPAPGRSYPRRAPGFPERRIVLTTDDRGLRNLERGGTYDVVVSGDSFTEGSMVDDAQVWWAKLAARTGVRIYNVAVSGLNPGEYLNNFAAYGLDARPRTAIFAIYEGNDFKAHGPRDAPAEARPGWVRRALGWLRDDSPIRGRLQRALVDGLAPIGADRPLPSGSGLDWMPLAVGEGATARHYAFEPRDVVGLALRRDFARSREWQGAAAAFEAIAALAAERKIRLVFLYVPGKEHVVLPLARERLSPESLHAFLSIGSREELPPAEELAERIYAGLDARESAMRVWCSEHGVEFVSATQALRERVARGEQAYFTYDQHWTELGHEAVAELLAGTLALP
jgi:hypothetical protein